MPPHTSNYELEPPIPSPEMDSTPVRPAAKTTGPEFPLTSADIGPADIPHMPPQPNYLAEPLGTIKVKNHHDLPDPDEVSTPPMEIPASAEETEVMAAQARAAIQAIHQGYENVQSVNSQFASDAPPVNNQLEDRHSPLPATTPVNLRMGDTDDLWKDDFKASMVPPPLESGDEPESDESASDALPSIGVKGRDDTGEMNDVFRAMHEEERMQKFFADGYTSIKGTYSGKSQGLADTVLHNQGALRIFDNENPKVDEPKADDKSD